MFRLQHKNILKNKKLFLRIIVHPIALFSKHLKRIQTPNSLFSIELLSLIEG